jgi:protein O-mannosyl-transferase
MIEQHRSRSFGRNELLMAAALAVATLAVYGQVVSHQFINLDDDLYIVDNPMVSRGLTLKGIAWAFTTFQDQYWHPLSWLSNMVDCQIFGLNAGGHLLVNVLIHVSNTLLLFLFLKRITGASWRSAIVAALFALHPLEVESVAWAIERKNTLSTLFGLLSLLAYARYAEAPSWRRYALVALWLGLGLMSKPTLVTWPFVLLLLDYWPLRRLEWQPADGSGRFAKAWVPLIREKLPLFCLVAASLVVAYLAHSSAGPRALVASFPQRLSNGFVSYGKYLLSIAWPSGLAVDYPFSPVPAWQLAAAVILLLAITAIAIREGRKQPYLIAGWLWFLGTLVPVIGLVQVGAGPAMSDHFCYIPSIGVFIAIVFGLTDIAIAWHLRRVTIAVACAIVFLIMCSLSAIQVRRWRDSVTLFEWTLSVTSNNPLVENQFGVVLNRQGKHAEAIAHFAEALRVKPDYFQALANMGWALGLQGKTGEAIEFLKRAVSVRPDSANTHVQLAFALVKQKQEDEALQHFYKAVELAPNDADVRTNLGLMLTRRKQLSEAATQLNEAIRLNPNSAEAHNNLGLVLLMEGRPEESVTHFSTALSLKPNFNTARDNLRRAQRQIDARPK